MSLILLAVGLNLLVVGSFDAWVAGAVSGHLTADIVFFLVVAAVGVCLMAAAAAVSSLRGIV